MQQRWNPNSSSDEDDDSWPRQTEPMLKRRRKLLVVDEEEADDSGGEEVADEDMEVLKPIGEVVRVSGSGGQKINHYKAFDFAGNIYKLGRPKCVTPKYSLAPLVPRLSELIGFQVVKADDCIGLEVEKLVASLPGDGVLFLENVRFYKEEEKIEPEFAKKLASLADLFVIQCPNGAAFSMGLLFRDRIHKWLMKWPQKADMLGCRRDLVSSVFSSNG